jgi:hypothetical protein
MEFFFVAKRKISNTGMGVNFTRKSAVRNENKPEGGFVSLRFV